jgi:hypothetical protein
MMEDVSCVRRYAGQPTFRRTWLREALMKNVQVANECCLCVSPL